MTEVEALWQRGDMRAAHAASARAAGQIGLAHPFRDTVDPIATATRLHEHGRACWHVARFADARRALDRAHELRALALGDHHVDTLDTLERRAAVADYERAADAPARFVAVVDGLARAFGDDHVRVAIARRNLAACLRGRGDAVAARETIDRARVVLDRELPAEHADRIDALKVDALLRVNEREPWQALQLAELAIRLGERCWDLDHPFVASAGLIAARAELAVGQPRRARERLDPAIKFLERAYGPHPLLAIALALRARAAAASEAELAERLARRAVEMYRATYAGTTLVEIARAHVGALVALGRLPHAIEVVLELEPHATASQRRALADQLADALADAGDHDSAQIWRARAAAAARP